MCGARLPRVMVLVIVLCGLAWPALAQNDDQDRATGYNAIIDNIDVLVDNYAKFLVRKYNLSEEQDEYTKYLLRERSYEFLDKHEHELRGLVDQMFNVRTGGDMNPEELIEWGKGVRPIYEAAKKLIIDGNEEWREILTPEQKKTHDEDLRLMYESFVTTEDQLERIVSGEMTVDEFRSPRRSRRRPSRSTAARSDEQPAVSRVSPDPDDQPPPAEPGPPAAAVGKPRPRERTAPRHEPPPERPGGRPSAPGPAEAREARSRGAAEPARVRAGRSAAKASEKGFESQWEKYVREFIQKYKLNDEQSQKAYAVLEDCKSQANRYLRGHQEQIDKLDQQLAALKGSKDKNKSKTSAELTDKRKKLMQPLDQVFERQLKPRLQRLPTRSQLRAAETAAKKKPAVSKTPAKKSEKKPSPQDEEE